MHSLKICNQNILRLNVPVNHISLLQIEQGFDHLGDNVPGTILCEALLSAKFLIEVAMLAHLKHHVDVLCIVEVAMKTHNIWMVKSPLNFKLAFHLTEEVELLKHGLENDLEGTGDTSRSLNGLEHLTKFATAYGRDAREVLDRPAVLPLLHLRSRSQLLSLYCVIRTASCDFYHIFYSLKITYNLNSKT